MLLSECAERRENEGHRGFRWQAEAKRLISLQADLDIAFSFLHMAEVEIHGGNASHAAELIAKAILAHKTALKCLTSVPPGFEEEKRELQTSARRLLEAIRASERHFGILQIAS